MNSVLGLCLAAGLASLLTAPIGSACAASVTTSRYDEARSGTNNEETILSPASISNGKLQRIATLGRGLDQGELMTSELLYLSGQQITSRGERDVVLVGTNFGRILAFDANARGTAADQDQLLWASDVLATIPGAALDMGIASAPVVDAERQVLFAVARYKAQDEVRFTLFSVDLRSGDLLGRVDIDGEYGFAVAGRQHRVRFFAGKQLQRPGLALIDGQVVVCFSLAGEHDHPGHGWIMAFQPGPGSRTFAQTGILATTVGEQDNPVLSPAGVPLPAGAGIWQGGRAPVVNQDGTFLVITSNTVVGTEGASEQANPEYVPGEVNGEHHTFGDAVLKIRLDPAAPAGQSLSIVGASIPGNWREMDARDDDLGSSGGTSFADPRDPSRSLVVSGGKSRYLFVLDPANMGEPDKASGAPVVGSGPCPSLSEACEMAVDLPPDTPLAHIIGGVVALTIEEDGARSARLYNWASADIIRSFDLSATASGRLGLAATAHAGRAAAHPGGMLTLTSNGGKKDSAIVWAIAAPLEETSIAGSRANSLRVYAFDADLRPLWQSEGFAPHWTSGKFRAPLVIDGKLYFGATDRITVYGLTDRQEPRS